MELTKYPFAHFVKATVVELGSQSRKNYHINLSFSSYRQKMLPVGPLKKKPEMNQK